MLQRACLQACLRRNKSVLRRQRWASERKKDPKHLAVQYFDMFYGPTYRDQWPSIRLALLSDPKYCALVNNLVDSGRVVSDLEALGVVDLFQCLGGEFTPSAGAPVRPAPPPRRRAAETQPLPLPTRLHPESVDDFVPSTQFIGRDAEGIDVQVRSPPPDWSPRIMPYDVQLPDCMKVLLFPAGDLTLFPPSPAAPGGETLAYYLMDAASLLPVIAMDVQKGDIVLDMCAAPGGKSLALLQTLQIGKLVCNEMSLKRFNRLRRTLNFYVPLDSALRRCIVLKRMDASSGDWTEVDAYDKVLVDAPCTSDRLSTEDDLNLFRKSRGAERNELPLTQMALIRNGLRSLVSGGSLVYSTCTLSPVQNDGVVEGVLESVTDCDVVVCDLTTLADRLAQSGLFHLHPCQYGLQVVPNVLSNFGPLYLSKLIKIN